jgi:RNA polymerase sigma-70 factor (ECF subfamily)
MAADDSFARFLVRLGCGDQNAATEIFQRFTNRLIGLARLHLDSRIRQKIDPEDVLQSVYRSFFIRQVRGEFDFDGWDGLWSLLTVITVRKCARVSRHFRTGSRNLDMEVYGPSAKAVREETWEGIDRGPTPEHAVMMAELVEQLMGELGERDRTIASMGLQGYTAAEIAEQTGVPASSVYRTLGLIKTRLQERDN